MSEKNSRKERKATNADVPSKQEEQENTRQTTTRPSRRELRRRKFPIWLRIIVVLLLAVIALIVGLMIGYGIIGDGAPLDILKGETWQHIIDIVVKPE